MATLRSYLNSKIKEKGSTLAKEKAKAEKYKSIAAIMNRFQYNQPIILTPKNVA